MSEHRPLGKIRMTPLRTGGGAPAAAPAQPGRHRRATSPEAAPRIPAPRTPDPSETDPTS